jgi:hypothetical protein
VTLHDARRRHARRLRQAIAALGIGTLVSAATLADTGYRIDYDYPGQGADWYARGTGTEANYDYPPHLLDLRLSGDDFGAGYDPAFDVLGLGPALERTQRNHTEYAFRFGPRIPDCANGVDDDHDGLADYPGDPGCLSDLDRSEREPGGAECDDGIDNDLDGLSDFPADPGCTNPFDRGERDSASFACDDGLDNDGDGLADYPADPGCSSAFDADERDAGGPACDDGLDNDGDGLLDYPDDPGCLGPLDVDERDFLVLSMQGDQIFWNPLRAAIAYDVVMGDLRTLRQGGGDFTKAVLECPANDIPDPNLGLRAIPDAGEGYFFVARPVFPRANGTYDSGGVAQVGLRDDEINASPNACP